MICLKTCRANCSSSITHLVARQLAVGMAVRNAVETHSMFVCHRCMQCCLEHDLCAVTAGVLSIRMGIMLYSNMLTHAASRACAAVLGTLPEDAFLMRCCHSCGGYVWLVKVLQLGTCEKLCC
jgi:hypothetical protein